MKHLKLIFSLFILSILSINLNAQSEKLSVYTFSKGRISIKLPGKATETVTAKDSYTIYQQMTTVNDNVYMLSYTLHQSNLSDPDHLTDVGAESFVEVFEGKLKNQKSTKKDGIKVIDCLIEKDGVHVLYKTFIKGQIQYQIVYISANEKALSKGKKYMKSYKLL